ncbi:MAG: hypothetical protein JXQ75_12910 [Phycisphaerae bacterium]|nr:hypothetical protein [Phycisphaerae bacterium]
MPHKRSHWQRRLFSATTLTAFLLAIGLTMRTTEAGFEPATSAPSRTTSGPANRSTPATAGPAGTRRAGDRSCLRFQGLIEAAGTPLEESRACLAGARCILVEQCAPMLSAVCFGTAATDASLVRASAEGLALLNRAAAALGRAGNDVGDGVIIEMEDRIDLLRAFGEVFSAMGGDGAGATRKNRLIAACNGLAIYLDDENAKLVASAKLWMGVAYRLAGRPERTVQMLRPILATPPDASIGLTARLQWCLALGDRGDHAAALALCLRIGHRVEAWFADEDPATRTRAMNSVRSTRVELLRGWAARLREAGQADRAEQAEAEARQLIGSDPYPFPPERMICLAESIAGLPEWDLSVPAPPAAGHQP